MSGPAGEEAGMDADLIFSLIDRFDQSSLTEVEFCDGDTSLSLKKTNGRHLVYTQPVMVQPHSIHTGPYASEDMTAARGAPEVQETGLPGNAPIPSGDEPTQSAATTETEVITAPIVGTFYRSPAPDAGAFVAEGDVVEAGRTLCILEAMKVMNELEADFTMEIVAIPAQNGEMVEYGSPLFEVRRL